MEIQNESLQLYDEQENNSKEKSDDDDDNRKNTNYNNRDDEYTDSLDTEATNLLLLNIINQLIQN